jgi:glycine/D-amino acid oxidase-like deaminating enzyme
MYINEPVKKIKVVHETDICVVGGSCTGVFAAVNAARLGASVAIIEKNNCFGGVATSACVHIWHSFHDEVREKRIIAGLSHEVIERLDKRDAVIKTGERTNAFHTQHGRT